MNRKLLKEYYVDADNSPDSIDFYDDENGYDHYCFDFGDDNAYPFFYLINEQQLIMGNPSTTHSELFDKYFWNFFLSNRDALESFMSFLNRFKMVAGRIWLLEDNETFKSIVSVWNFEEEVVNIANKLAYHLNLDVDEMLFADGMNVCPINEIGDYIPQNQEIKQMLQAIHLANQEDKRDLLANFRKIRDEKNAKKIRDAGFGTEAEYRFYNHLDEVKKTNDFRPDDFTFDNEDYAWYKAPEDCINYVFVICDDGRIIIDNYETHFELIEYELSDEELGREEDDERDFDDVVDEWMMSHICGRVYTTPSKNYSCIITVWSHPEDVKYFYAKMCRQIAIDPKRALLLTKDDAIWLHNNKDYIVKDDAELATLRQIHLADQKAKRNFFDKFRQNRDAIIAQKNRENGWGNASQAEVNFWRNKGLDEAISRKIKHKLNEYSTPDGITVVYKNASAYRQWYKKNAFAFIYDPKTNRLIVDERSTHYKVYKNSNWVQFDNDGYPIELDQGEMINKGYALGRVYVCENLPFSCVFTMWNDEDVLPKIYKRICLEIQNKYNVDVDYSTAIFADGDDVIEIRTMQEYEPQDNSEKEVIRQIHLADQKTKNEFFAQFRRNRDEYQSKQNKANGWNNASQAEVNFWKNKGLDETISRKIKQKINEYASPDEINFTYNNEKFTNMWRNECAFGFIYDDKANKAYVGRSMSHYEISKRMPQFGKYGYNRIGLINLKDYTVGRVYVNISPNSEISCVFTAWNHDEYIPQIYKEICNEIIRTYKIRIDINKAVYANGYDIIQLKDNSECECTNSEERNELQAIHLADQKAKNEFFAQFRKTRDERNAKKIKDAGFGTEAEYRFYNHLDEIISNRLKCNLQLM